MLVQSMHFPDEGTGARGVPGSLLQDQMAGKKWSAGQNPGLFTASLTLFNIPPAFLPHVTRPM